MKGIWVPGPKNRVKDLTTVAALWMHLVQAQCDINWEEPEYANKGKEGVASRCPL